jgi:hypothetical protein
MIGGITALLLAGASQQSAITSRYTKLSSCRLWKAGEVSKGPSEDWGILRCRGLDGYPVWMGIQEGTHMNLGFGKRPSFSGMFETNRNDDWPIEWRGRVVKGRFVPSAAIVRIRARFDDSGASDLAVFHMLDDGISCAYPTTITTNAEARKIADAVPTKDNCYIGP